MVIFSIGTGKPLRKFCFQATRHKGFIWLEENGLVDLYQDISDFALLVIGGSTNSCLWRKSLNRVWSQKCENCEISVLLNESEGNYLVSYLDCQPSVVNHSISYYIETTPLLKPLRLFQPNSFLNVPWMAPFQIF